MTVLVSFSPTVIYGFQAKYHSPEEFLSHLVLLQMGQSIRQTCCWDLLPGMTQTSLLSFTSLVVRKRSLGFPTKSDTNWAVQLQKMARGLKFRIEEVEILYYPCSENKGADQLRGNREADLRLCFRIC